MDREEIVRGPEPDHIIRGPRVGVGPVFRHDFLFLFGDHLPRDFDFRDHVRSGNPVAEFPADVAGQSEGRKHHLGVKTIHAQHPGNGNVARVNPVAIPRAGTEIDDPSLILHLVAFHVIEGYFPHAFGQRCDLSFQSSLGLRLRRGKLGQTEIAIRISQGICGHHQRTLFKKEPGFLRCGLRKSQTGASERKSQRGKEAVTTPIHLRSGIFSAVLRLRVKASRGQTPRRSAEAQA